MTSARQLWIWIIFIVMKSSLTGQLTLWDICILYNQVGHAPPPLHLLRIYMNTLCINKNVFIFYDDFPYNIRNGHLTSPFLYMEEWSILYILVECLKINVKGKARNSSYSKKLQCRPPPPADYAKCIMQSSFHNYLPFCSVGVQWKTAGKYQTGLGKI